MYEVVQPTIKEDERREIVRALLTIIERPSLAALHQSAAYLLLEHAQALIRPMMMLKDPTSSDAAMMRKYWDDITAGQKWTTP